MWLMARAMGASVPRRLIYVVDRRAVVDQATEFVIDIRERLEQVSNAGLKLGLGLGAKPLPMTGASVSSGP